MNFEEFYPSTFEGAIQTGLLDFTFKPSSCLGPLDIWFEDPVDSVNDFRDFIKHLTKSSFDPDKEKNAISQFFETFTKTMLRSVCQTHQWVSDLAARVAKNTDVHPEVSYFIQVP